MNARLGEVYLKIAKELAFDHKIESVRYIVKVFSVNFFTYAFFVTIVKILTPRSLINLRRTLRFSKNETSDKADY
jgi:hypothetical protein